MQTLKPWENLSERDPRAYRFQKINDILTQDFYHRMQ